jgi:hypothetical protein
MGTGLLEGGRYDNVRLTVCVNENKHRGVKQERKM